MYIERHPGDIPEGSEGVVSWIGIVLRVGIMREEGTKKSPGHCSDKFESSDRGQLISI